MIQPTHSVTRERTPLDDNDRINQPRLVVFSVSRGDDRPVASPVDPPSSCRKKERVVTHACGFPSVSGGLNVNRRSRGPEGIGTGYPDDR